MTTGQVEVGPEAAAFPSAACSLAILGSLNLIPPYAPGEVGDLLATEVGEGGNVGGPPACTVVGEVIRFGFQPTTPLLQVI